MNCLVKINSRDLEKLECLGASRKKVEKQIRDDDFIWILLKGDTSRLAFKAIMQLTRKLFVNSFHIKTASSFNFVIWMLLLRVD